ncbi:23S rRNA (uracil(1939)-C(5))-methyltransferase RlmD [candidate division KSB1 bacterium]|nr:23S rRNA (uracil(1939)-C(5))-methyltransferase RlmD [candidate division KSB1 bacterium]
MNNLHRTVLEDAHHMSTSLHKGDEVILKIDSLAFGGLGVARLQDRVVFVDKALPGQTVRARIFKLKKKFAQARILEIVKQSPFYQKPRCTHFGACGGCSIQHLDYIQQLHFKEQQVRESLEHLGGFQNIPLKPILASPESFSYRNKMEFSFSPHRWLSNEEMIKNRPEKKELYLGLHAKNFYNKVVDIQQCHLVAAQTNDILRVTREFAAQTGLPAYDSKQHIGFWRFLVVRHSKNINNLMVNLVTFDYNPKVAKNFKKLMTATFPQITSLLYSTTQNISGLAYGEKEYVLAGNHLIEEKLADYRFEISSNSFFQTNTLQTENLYQIVVELAAIQPEQVVYDLFCGAGTISIFASRLAHRVVGFEIVPDAVDDAIRNARKNNINNCDFLVSDLRTFAKDWQQPLQRYGKPAIMIIDPPRGGMHPKTIDAILELEPPCIIHVSCNPTTLARDLKILCEQKYYLQTVQPVDMFPHTHHIEVVVKLLLINNQ